MGSRPRRVKNQTAERLSGLLLRMAPTRYANLATSYVAAATALTQPTSVALAEGDADDWLIRSQEIENALADDLHAGDSDVREAAALQLQGYAALDVAVAVDLARQLDGAEAVGLAEDAPSQFETTLKEVDALLAPEPALGIRAETVALGTTPATLRDAAHDAIDAISGDAGQIASAAVGGLGSIPVNALFASFGQAADKWLNALYEKASHVAQAVIKALTKAASKVLRLLGPLEAPVRGWLEKRIGEITLDKVVGALSDALLGVGDLRRKIDELIGTHSDSPAAEDAKARLAALSGRFGKQRKLITIMLKLLGKIQGWVMTLAQWAAAALAGVYLLVLAYGIVAAGDFLDWTRIPDTSPLDLVDGVRSIVAGAVALGICWIIAATMH